MGQKGLPLLLYFLHRSESPSQIFIIVLFWLFTILKYMNPLNWGGVFLAYDNMCHLDGLKAAKNPLPLAAPWDRAWMCIQKIIDSLHIRDHKDQSCKESYNPANLKKELPDGNTMAADISKHLCGCHASRKFYVPCQKSTIYFIYIGWLNIETDIQQLVTRTVRSHCCQRLVEQQAELGRTKCITGIQQGYFSAVLQAQFFHTPPLAIRAQQFERW